MADKHILFLHDAAEYFERRPTGGEDRAHWANVYNAKSCREVAAEIEQLREAVSGVKKSLTASAFENAKLRAALEEISSTTVSSWIGDIHEDAQNEWRDRLDDAISIARAALEDKQ